MATVDEGLKMPNCDDQITAMGSSRWIWNPEPLTLREYDVLCGLVTRKSYGEIAKDLGVSLNTVKFHTKNIYSKWGVARRMDLIAFLTSHAFAGKTGHLLECPRKGAPILGHVNGRREWNTVNTNPGHR